MAIVRARLRRKRWLALLAACVCLSAPQQTVYAQKATKVWHIGLCHVGLDHEPPGLQTLHQALNDLGYQDGTNLRFDWRNQKDAAAATATIKGVGRRPCRPHRRLRGSMYPCREVRDITDPDRIRPDLRPSGGGLYQEPRTTGRKPHRSGLRT